MTQSGPLNPNKIELKRLSQLGPEEPESPQPVAVMGGLKLWGVLGAVFLVGTGAFHTPYKPEKSRHFDASKSSSFSAITDKVAPDLRERRLRSYSRWVGCGIRG